VKRPPNLAVLLLASSLLLVGNGCCQRIGPVLGRPDLTRQELVLDLGQPTLRKTGAASDLTLADVEDRDLLALVTQLAPNTPVELLKWKSECWMSTPQYFVGVFEPSKGTLLTVGGKGLYAMRFE